MGNNDINILNTSLIYKMSLGSKELYHSNIWTWLIEQDSEFVQAFFPLSTIPQGASFDKVTREEGNRDISIWYVLPDNSRKCFVVENKLKSIPYAMQLEKYADGLGESFAEGVLTGLTRPNIVNENGVKTTEKGKMWRFVPYSKISEEIRRIAKKSTVTSIVENRDSILEYVRNNDCVERIVKSAIVDNRLEQTWDSALNELGLSDLVNKITGSMLVHYVTDRFKQDGIDIPFFFTAEGFHHKKTTLDFRLSNWDDYCDKKYTYLKIGVQIEAYQYRRMVDRVGGYCGAEAIFQEFSKKGFFDYNYDKKEKLIKFPNDIMERPTNMNKAYDKYGDTCVYQYSRLEGEDLNFENIYQRIKNDLLVASKIMEENNKEGYRDSCNRN